MKRNVLLIIADQFRADCLGAAGNPVIRTPNLDRLAARGVLFTNAFVQTCPCGPSRMCINTGRYLCSTRSVNNMTPLADAHEALPMYLREAGYAPGLLGYNDYAIDPRILPEGHPLTTSLSYENVLPGYDWIYRHEYHSPEYFAYLRERGYPEEWCEPRITRETNVPRTGAGECLPLRFPAFYAEEDSEANYLTTRAIDAIARSNAGWFYSVNYIKPHPPRICPAPYHNMYEPGAMPRANRRPEELENSHPYLRRARRGIEEMNDRALRETQACYYGMVTEIDACVGRLLGVLEANGSWDDTLIIFTSDHGEYLGDHYFWEKAHFYDSTMRVPLIIREPSPRADVTRGQRIDAFVESIDLAPTILEFVGAAIPDRIQGRSLLPLVHGIAPRVKDGVVFEYDFRHMFRERADIDPDECILWVYRDDRFKYVQFGIEWMPPMLFDLMEDPDEQHDCAGCPESTGILAEYAQRMLRWRMKNEDQRMEHWASKYRA